MVPGDVNNGLLKYIAACASGQFGAVAREESGGTVAAKSPGAFPICGYNRGRVDRDPGEVRGLCKTRLIGGG